MEHQISGQYQRIGAENADGTGIHNLRIDIDGERPLNIISGHLHNSKGCQNAVRSFIFKVDRKVENGETLELICINGKLDPKNDTFSKIKIEAPLGMQSHDISVHCVNSQGDDVAGFFRKTSSYFKKVTINHCYEEAAEPLCSYNTKALESVSQRTSPLSLEGAFAEAGIEVTLNEDYSPIAHPKSEGLAWNVEELQAMHIPMSNATPSQESIWLLSAHEYVINTVKGLRIVDAGTGKVGCVVFQNATGWETPEEKRLRLFIYMHELGHCLNLKHPWEQAGSAGYSTLSWMNYPWRYSHSEQEYGSEAFWRKFNFEFSDLELLKLRHGF